LRYKFNGENLELRRSRNRNPENQGEVDWGMIHRPQERNEIEREGSVRGRESTETFLPDAVSRRD